MLPVGRVVLAVGEHGGERGAAAAHALGRRGAQGVGEQVDLAVQPARGRARWDLDVLEQGAPGGVQIREAAGRAEVVLEHEPLAGGVADDVQAGDADPDAARRLDAAHLGLEVVGGADHLGRDEALGDDRLRAVDVGDERVERADALCEAALDGLPLGGGDDARHRVDVELEVALHRRETHAGALERARDAVGQARRVGATDGLERGTGPWPRRRVRGEPLVVDPIEHRVAGERVLRARRRGHQHGKPVIRACYPVWTLGPGRARAPNLSAMAPPAVLSIAGSDSGGGAGIQADLKAFARCGVHGMTAITALTAQNTVGVTGIHAVPGEFIVEQVRTVAEDIGVDAVKIGMLGTAEIVRAVREALGHIGDGVPIVIDPVMVAESGAVLLDDAARAAIVTELLPLATVITPNLPEARVLAAGEAARAERGARRRRGPRARPARPRAGQRRHHRRPPRRGHRRLLRRRRDPAPARRAAPGRGVARLRLHALERARRAPRARLQPAGSGPRGARDRLRGGPRRPPRDRRRSGAGERPGSLRPPPAPGEPGPARVT